MDFSILFIKIKIQLVLHQNFFLPDEEIAFFGDSMKIPVQKCICVQGSESNQL